MRSSKEIRRELIQEYNKDPTGWRVYVGRDVRGYTDLIFTHGRDVWFLKEEAISPYENVGLGIKSVMARDGLAPSLPTFGFRPLSKDLVESVWKAISEQRGVGNLIMKLLDQKPRPLSSIMAEALLEGPIIGSPRTLEIFPEQRELDLKLRRDLEKLLERKYPHLLTTYR
ncbi:MAG: hypothetical protein QW815_07500 [Nitrososphaerota archaeon]